MPLVSDSFKLFRVRCAAVIGFQVTDLMWNYYVSQPTFIHLKGELVIMF